MAALDGLLLPPEQLNSLLKTTGLAVQTSKKVMYHSQTTANDCGGSIWTAWGPAYNGSGWVAVRHKYLNDSVASSRATIKVFQSVVSFPLPVDANAFFRKQVAAWPTCNDRHLEARDLDEARSPDFFWKISEATEHDGTLTMARTQEDTDGRWACERALTVRNNVVIDVNVCGEDVADQGQTVATALARKVPVS
ncbi:sensor domain-containing protein [Mycobacterium sp.]|uniref:sensor domain-containing protein n=1 Tax=Mycobacterium sp. TaxID=1785 RepID=UPI003BA9CDAB